jgi:type IX secretion system PorP/SprF family membrane protein
MKISNMDHYRKYNLSAKFIFIATLVCAFNLNSNAQTEPMYAQYMFNMSSINPAYAGSREALGVSLYQRNQWLGLEGAPSTTSLSVDGVSREKNIGWNFHMYNDKLGVERATGFNGMISTRLKVSDEGNLSAGIMLGLMDYRIDLMSLGQQLYQKNDPAFYNNFSKVMPTLGFGVYYNTDKYYLGASLPSILLSRSTDLDLIKSGLQKTNKQHIFLNGGFVFEINNEVKLKPSTMVKMVSGAPIEFDLNTNVWLKDMIGLGVSYRTGDGIVGMAEYQVNESFRLGYAFDKTTSPLRYYNNGTHEFMIRYEFMNNRYKIKSTRHF